MSEHFNFGETAVGMGQPTYVVAEIGINHNGDMEIVKGLIDAAHRAGVDAYRPISKSGNGRRRGATSPILNTVIKLSLKLMNIRRSTGTAGRQGSLGSHRFGMRPR